MNQVTVLREALRPHLAWHGARLSFLAAFLIALLRVRTINFAELATGFAGKAQTDSHYKRIQRFFRDYELDYAEVAQTVVNLMAIPEPWVLSLDRTEWQFGECIFNILMLGVVHEGVAFPLTWCLLDKRQLWGQWVYIAALRLEDGSLLVVATQRSPQSAIAEDAKRWGIETLFGIFKTRGFCLESTHLTDGERLSKLLALLSLALCWVFLVGEWLHQLKPLRLKKHGRKAKSLFRYGLDYLRGVA